jgi:hypothetical protein
MMHVDDEANQRDDQSDDREREADAQRNPAVSADPEELAAASASESDHRRSSERPPRSELFQRPLYNGNPGKGEREVITKGSARPPFFSRPLLPPFSSLCFFGAAFHRSVNKSS